jgi:hypothetical protein
MQIRNTPAPDPIREESGRTFIIHLERPLSFNVNRAFRNFEIPPFVHGVCSPQSLFIVTMECGALQCYDKSVPAASFSKRTIGYGAGTRCLQEIDREERRDGRLQMFRFRPVASLPVAKKRGSAII